MKNYHRRTLVNRIRNITVWEALGPWHLPADGIFTPESHGEGLGSWRLRPTYTPQSPALASFLYQENLS